MTRTSPPPHDADADAFRRFSRHPCRGRGAARAAESAEERGLKIATEARERDKGFGNFTANLTMTLRNKRGQESKRQLRLQVIEVENDGDRTIFVFDRPRNVKGTGFLVHAHKTGPDDQWLYPCLSG